MTNQFILASFGGRSLAVSDEQFAMGTIKTTLAFQTVVSMHEFQINGLFKPSNISIASIVQ